MSQLNFIPEKELFELLKCLDKKCKSYLQRHIASQNNTEKSIKKLIKLHEKKKITTEEYNKYLSKYFEEEEKIRKEKKYVNCQLNNCLRQTRNYIKQNINNRLKFMKKTNNNYTELKKFKLIFSKKITINDVVLYNKFIDISDKKKQQ